MYAVEFEAKITNGHIVIPAELGLNLSGSVRVILLQEESNGAASLLPSDGKESFRDDTKVGEAEEIDFLTYRMKHPYQIPDFQPLTREQIHERRPDYE